MSSSWIPFISPKDYDLTLSQLGFLTSVYGYVLFQASNLISDGSELLLFVPALQGIIGSVILPVFGAVPDGMMVLFSGLGDREGLQHEVAVGVGTLAGSTIMLLTLPWCLAIVSGRVTINKDGTPNYKRPRGVPASGWHKLNPPGYCSLTRTGIQGSMELKTNALLMLATMTTYLLIQVPAFFDDKSTWSYNKQGHAENNWALLAFLCSAVWFLVYLVRQYRESRKESDEGSKTFAVAVDMDVFHMMHLIDEGKFTLFDAVTQFKQESEQATGRQMSRLLPMPGHGAEEVLLGHYSLPKKPLARLKVLLKHMFEKYETNDYHEIGEREFYLLCQDMHLKASKEEQQRMFQAADIDSSGSISFKEFTSTVIDFSRFHGEDVKGVPPLPTQRSISQIHSLVHNANEEHDSKASPEVDEDEDESGEDEPPEDLQDVDPRRQQLWILLRSFKLMLSGTFLVLVFSDPMVDVLAEIGSKLDVSPFYVSFVIAPIASNASELVAAYNYARKRTERTITVSISTLQGAACMNNTFCLSIFMGLIYFRQLAWQFSAECLAILMVEVILAIYSYTKRIQTLLDAVLIATLYPVSLALVWLLKNPAFVGID